MNPEIFLQACIEGNEELVRSVQKDLSMEDLRPLAYSVDEEGRNALHLAVLHGHWRLALFLVWKMRVSPHKLTSERESIFHSIVRGHQVREPTREDFQEIEEVNTKIWEQEHNKVVSQVEEVKANKPSLQEPTELVNKTASRVAHDIFGNPKLTMSKYILLRYHVVLEQENLNGYNPAALARELRIRDLEEYFSRELQPAYTKQRLILGLNDNLFKKLLQFL